MSEDIVGQWKAYLEGVLNPVISLSMVEAENGYPASRPEKVACPLQVKGATLPQVKDFRYLVATFMIGLAPNFFNFLLSLFLLFTVAKL